MARPRIAVPQRLAACLIALAVSLCASTALLGQPATDPAPAPALEQPATVMNPTQGPTTELQTDELTNPFDDDAGVYSDVAAQYPGGGYVDGAFCPAPPPRCWWRQQHAHWEFRAAGAVMHRSPETDTSTLLTDPLSNVRQLNVQNLELDWEGGTDTELQWNGPGPWGLDVGLLRVNQWSDGDSVRNMMGFALNPAFLASIGATPPNPPGTFPANGFQQALVRYDSELHSFHFNVRRQWNEYSPLTLVAGFRFVQLDEKLHGAFVTTNMLPPPSSANGGFATRYETENDLYGFQLGADLRIVDGCWYWFDVSMRAGVFHNDVQLRTVIDSGNVVNATFNNGLPATPPIGTLMDQRIAVDNDRTSFLGELGMRGHVDLNGMWSLFVEYQFLWLEDVALATDQNSFMPVSASGSPFYHGALIGIQFIQ